MVRFITIHKRLIALLSLLMVAAIRVSAVPVHINSGNPAYPFPQFLEYAYGDSHRLGNLATRNPEGVVHAEMEQDIRNAYQVHANEFKYTGESWAGIKYISTPYKSAYDCTEGDGYALLAAAYMADQVTFNGYWMCTHDKRLNRSKKYRDCSNTASTYAYGPFALSDRGEGGNTAADGDVDVALALYVAYKQWGEFMRDESGAIVNDACGNPISYKEAMIEVIRGLVALSTRFPTENPMRVNSGMIGLDGYPKGGDTWNEQTGFVTANNPLVFSESKEIYSLPGNNMVDVNGLTLYPEFCGATTQHIDYNAPAYFREFYELFEELGGDPWEIEQFRRGEASSDWLIGELIKKSSKSIPTAGWVSVFESGENVSYWQFTYDDDGKKDSVLVSYKATEAGTEFSNFNQGEDYRCSWRTICNYMWHGNPSYSWNSKTHKVEQGGNTYEYDAAVRLSDWMNDPSNWNPAAGNHCIDYGSVKNMPYSGPATIRWQNDPNTGKSGADFYCSLSMQTGTGSYAAVGSQDYELMGLVYRECNIKWDTKGDATDIDVPRGQECNLGKVSNYMHGWARQMGMMVTSGNYPAPSAMNPMPNMKIYRAIKDSVTFCYTGDEITYLLDYRNYGSVDAKDVVIVEHVPAHFDVVSTGGGVYDAASHTITWNIGDVSGYHSDGKEEGAALDVTRANFKKTIGQVSYTVSIGSQASGRYCTTAEITCSNGLGWVSNEYPNYRTATMQRNCVDVLKRSLVIEKKADRDKINPGNVATFSIDFENSSEAGWIDGGRPRVNVSWACEDQGNQMGVKFRLFNDAVESYINYGNYRISYYLYDPVVTGVVSPNSSDGWAVIPSIYEGGNKEGFVVTHENVVSGTDSVTGRKWNQRISMQFAPLLVTTTMLTSWNTGNPNCTIHEGGDYPLRVVNLVNGNNYSDKVDWTDDWSFSEKYKDGDEGNYYPITPSWQRLDESGKTIEEPITKWLTCGCTSSSITVPNVLVEEYDGYVWRRILGNGPIAGRDVEDVYVRDTLPLGLEFVSFLNDCPLEDFGATIKTTKTSDGRDVIEWHVPKMQVSQKGTIKYNAVVKFPSGASCVSADEVIVNHAWISGLRNSAVDDTAQIIVTCEKVPDPIVPTTMKKVADKERYEVGDDIVYEIEYEQTHGALFENAGSNSSDWTTSGGSPRISNGTISLSNGASAEFKYSKSTNITVSMDCDLNRGNSERDAEAIVYFRDDLRLGIFPNYDGGAALVINMYDKTRLLKNVNLSLKESSFHMIIELNGDVLRAWIAKNTSVEPAFSISGLTEKDGYFGFKSPSNGSSSFSNINVHTDYAYDLTIVDRKPAEVSFSSADNGGALQGDSIVWKFEQGIDNPIPFGKKYTVSWKGVVDDCSESIINVAYTKLLGHKDNEIMSQAVSGCGEDCPLPNTTMQISRDTICAGESVTLTAGPVGNNITYRFEENGQPISEQTSNNTCVVTPIAAGTFEYTASVFSRPDSSCYSPAPVVSLVVEKLPVVSDYDLGTFCPGNADVSDLEREMNEMLSKDVAYSWFDSNGDPTTAPDVNSITEAGDYSYTYSLTSKSGCESRKKGTLKFTVRKISAPTGTGAVSYLLGDTAANGQFDKNILLQDPSAVEVESGYTYNWFDENGQPLSSAPTPTPQDVGKKIVYGVNRTQPVGCVSDTFYVTVTVSGSSVPVPNHVTYCLNDVAQPISATASEVKDSNSSWEVVYYDADGNELTTESDRTPNTSEGGAVTYYVSQREVGNPTNESGKVPLTVTIVEIPAPDISMNRTQYCKGEEYEQLQVKSSSLTLDAGKSSFSWSVDGQSVTGVPLAQTQTSVVQYGVVESYEIESGRFCVSDTAKFAVKTTFVPVATGSLSVNYLKSEAAADGSFDPLLTKDPSAVTASDNSDYELVWFDEALNELGTTDPSPKKDNTWEENKDVKLTYFVKQRHKESGCLSDTVRITVILSDALMPNTFPMNYCHHAKAVSLENNASINTNNGQVKDIDYELEWFSPEDNYAAPLASAPVPSTETVGVTIYKVAQKHKVDGVLSTKAEVKVTVFPNPEIKVDALPQTCGEEIEISKYIHLANTIDTSLLNYYYFSDRNCTNPLSELTLTESTVFYANAYYTIFSEPNIIGYCASDTIEMNATIDDLTDLVVESPSSVCPNGDIHLKASATSTTSTVSYEWSGAATGSADVLDTKDESGTFGEVHSYHLTASAGACHLDTVVTVTVGKGELTGNVMANNQATHNLKICDGEPVELSATHEGQDFKWSDLSGGIVSSDKDVSVTPTATTTYVLSFVNKCETSDTVVVEVYPLSLTADFTLLDTSICEKSTATAVLTINGYDPSMTGSYIKWMKNGNELSEFAGQTTLLLNNVDKNDSGEYTYEVSNGICLAKTSDVKTTAQLEVKPYVSFAEPTTVLVPHGGSVDLKMLGLNPSDATVSWKGDLHDGASNPFTVTDMEKDELFAVTLSADGYCDSETEVQVLVDAKAVVSISVSADAVCVEDGVTVTADTTGTGHLLYPDRYQLTLYSIDEEANIAKLSEEGLSIHDAPQSSVSYFAVVTYGDQTATSDTLAVEIVSPAIYSVTENAVSCSGDEVTIEVSSDDEDVEVEWTEDGTKASSIVVAPTESRSYPFVITKKGLCPVTDQIPVSVKEKPSVTMDAEKTVCEGSDIIISPTVTGKEYSGFVWTDPEGEIISRELKLITAPTLSGDYTLQVETASCGDASASINVSVIPTPILYIDSVDFTTRKVEVASGGTGAFEYKMDKEDWQTENLYENLAYKVLHTAYARDEMGCVGVIVFSINQPPVPIPDYFTPDGSGTNEVWDVTPILDAYPGTTVKIYDRTGKVVAELDGSASDWDGTYNGRPLPSTDYWYVINVPEIRQQFTGHFTLIRSK
ncbi:MAG: T9SS type B sorting domain-containing protein [Paludibacteraceae bacterium]|nr:T9SS type B sorting domain-containing protein [Paludibacteraceae bacterium]